MFNVNSNSTVKLPRETRRFLSDLFEPVHSGLCATVFLKDAASFRKQEFGNPFQIRDVVSNVMSQYGDLPVDIYLTPNLARTTRRGNDFTELLTSCYVDLDYYKVGSWSGKSPRVVLKAVKAHLTRIGYPHPSMTVSSGRGLQLYWVFERPIPMKAFPRWNRLEETLIKKLSSFGSDNAASDPARVLRLPGSKTSRGGECHVLERLKRPGGKLRRINFEDLAMLVFPSTRRSSHLGQLVSNVEEWVEIHKHKKTRKWFFKSTPFSRQRFYGQIYEDLIAYIEAGKVKEGHRKLAVFHTIVAGCHARKFFPDKVKVMAKYFAIKIDPVWGARAFSDGDFAEVAKRFEDDLKVSNGSSPLYTPSVKKILTEVGISKADQMLCKRLCNENIRKENKNRGRRVHADRPMSVIQADRVKRQRQAKSLREKGWTVVRIAERLGVSKGTVSKYLDDGFKAKVYPKKAKKEVVVAATTENIVSEKERVDMQNVSNPSMLCLAKPAPRRIPSPSLLTQTGGLPGGRTLGGGALPPSASASCLVNAFLARSVPGAAALVSLADDGGEAVAPSAAPIRPQRSARSLRIIEELRRFFSFGKGERHG